MKFLNLNKFLLVLIISIFFTFNYVYSSINNKIIGIGETGLDFFYNNSDKDKQITSFKTHIEAAIECDVPIIIHSRDAEDDTFNILNEYKGHNPRILMHCFTGSKKFSEKCFTDNTADWELKGLAIDF